MLSLFDIAIGFPIDLVVKEAYQVVKILRKYKRLCRNNRRLLI